MLGHVDYEVVQDVESAHPIFTNVFSKVLLISVDKVVYGNNLTESGQSQRLQPEHMSGTDKRPYADLLES